MPSPVAYSFGSQLAPASGRRYPAVFILTGEPDTPTLRAPFSKWGQDFIPPSYAYFCPVCGEIWARFVTADPRAPHSALTIACRAHGSGRLSLIWDRTVADALPLSLLAREVLVEIEAQAEDQAEAGTEHGDITTISPPSPPYSPNPQPGA